MEGRFISISGVTNSDDLKTISRIAREEDTWERVVIGLQVSTRSINEGTRNPRQPSFGDIDRLIGITYELGMEPAIHYATRDLNTVIPDIKKMNDSLRYDVMLQFNTALPTQEILEFAREKGFQTIVALPLVDKSRPGGGYFAWKGKDSEDSRNTSAERLIERLLPIRKHVDYVLFDPSHGTGEVTNFGPESLAIQFGKNFFDPRVTGNIFRDVDLIYAGGIGPDNVHEVARAIYSSGLPSERVSIDSESNLRTDDKLDLDKVRLYLRGNNEALKANL